MPEKMVFYIVFTSFGLGSIDPITRQNDAKLYPQNTDSQKKVFVFKHSIKI